jgi:hypothetical protein
MDLGKVAGYLLGLLGCWSSLVPVGPLSVASARNVASV